MGTALKKNGWPNGQPKTTQEESNQRIPADGGCSSPGLSHALLLAGRVIGIDLVETVHAVVGNDVAGGERGKDCEDGKDLLHGVSPIVE